MSFVLCSLSAVYPAAPAAGRFTATLGALLPVWADLAQVLGSDLASVLADIAHVNEGQDQGDYEHNVLARYMEGELVSLEWNGVFTPRRCVELEIHAGTATLRWSSGTGRPSTYIGRALARHGLARIPRGPVPRGLSPETRGRLAALAI